jgi:hypothetical protein
MNAVIAKHHGVRQFGNYGYYSGFIALQHRIRWSAAMFVHRFRGWSGKLAQPSRPSVPAFGGRVMELQTRLNVLAAIISFAFLTAVVFGMF